MSVYRSFFYTLNFHLRCVLLFPIAFECFSFFRSHSKNKNRTCVNDSLRVCDVPRFSLNQVNTRSCVSHFLFEQIKFEMPSAKRKQFLFSGWRTNEWTSRRKKKTDDEIIPKTAYAEHSFAKIIKYNDDPSKLVLLSVWPPVICRQELKAISNDFAPRVILNCHFRWLTIRGQMKSVANRRMLQ